MKTNPIHQATRPRPRRRDAFTLVELLVVIAVITLLVGITVPTVFAVKNVAKAGATKALLNTIGQGLDMFKSESKLGRAYPPSFWDTSDGSPYSDSSDNWDAYGAQTLVWGLAGADLLGTPGFPDQVGGDVEMSTDEDDNGLYALDDGLPVRPRFGPFIDISKTKILKPSELEMSWLDIDEHDDFDQAPIIADAFDRVVLYYAIQPDKTGLEIYDPEHNEKFMDSDHDTIATDSKFYAYIKDERMDKLVEGDEDFAQNRDRYLLISPGIDGQFGTRDDLTNFKPNPQKP